MYKLDSCLQNKFDILTSYGEMNNQKINIDKKYKYLFIYIYNSDGLGGEAYDVRLLPSFIDFEIRLKVYGINMISNEINIFYEVSSHILHVHIADLGFQIFGIY